MWAILFARTRMKIKHTRQEWVDLAVKGLASQGWKQSITLGEWPSCAYRGENGCRCAIGWGIPDKAYHPSMEGHGAHLYATVSDALLVDGDRFLSQLQGVHDDHADPQAMEAAMRTFVQLRQLTWPQESPTT